MNEEEKKLENLWNEFIKYLEENGEDFDEDLKKYLNAIKYLADMEFSKIDVQRPTFNYLTKML